MRLALNADGVRRCEEAAVARGTTLPELMDRAGSAVAVEADSVAPEGRVAVVVGGGNNGGDGWVAARVLAEAGRDVVVLSLAKPDALPSPAREAAEAAVAADVHHLVEPSLDEVVLELAAASVVIDAVLGVGTRGTPRAPLAEVLEAMDDADAPVLAVDMPSGVDPDNGAVPGVAVHADVTATFGAPKIGQLLYPGAEYAGAVALVDIGLPDDVGAEGAIEMWEWPDLAFLLPLGGPLDDKRSRGRVLVVGGWPGMTGAACLAASAALRTGAGYVTVAVPEPSLGVVETKLTAPVKVALPVAADSGLGESGVDAVADLARHADAVVVGPGLGRADSTARGVRSLLKRLSLPVVVDADALWALHADIDALRARTAPTIITPHEVEAARLLGVSRDEVFSDRPAAARALAGGGVVCVLKGARTLVSDGERVVVTMTGGPGLATLGTGDVLAGMIGAELAQGLAPLDAAALAAHLHGAAGDAAEEALTQVCCTAEDVLTYLPEAVRSLLGE